jgi:hypothetical protein
VTIAGKRIARTSRLTAALAQLIRDAAEETDRNHF